MPDWKIKMVRALSMIHLVFTATPILTITAFLMLALAIHASLGRWPVVYNDNFAAGPIHILDIIAFYSALAFFASPVGWIVTGVVLVPQSRRSILKKRAFVYFGAFLALLGWVFLDTTGFFEWFMD